MTWIYKSCMTHGGSIRYPLSVRGDYVVYIDFKYGRMQLAVQEDPFRPHGCYLLLDLHSMVVDDKPRSQPCVRTNLSAYVTLQSDLN